MLCSVIARQYLICCEGRPTGPWRPLRGRPSGRRQSCQHQPTARFTSSPVCLSRAMRSEGASCKRNRRSLWIRRSRGQAMGLWLRTRSCGQIGLLFRKCNRGRGTPVAVETTHFDDQRCLGTIDVLYVFPRPAMITHGGLYGDAAHDWCRRLISTRLRMIL